LDVVGRQVVELARILLDTVNDIQGVTHVPNLNLGSGTGPTVGHTEGYAGDFSSEARTNRGTTVHTVHIFAGYRGDSTRERLFLLGSVAYYYYFFQRLGIDFQ